MQADAGVDDSAACLIPSMGLRFLSTVH